MLSPLPGAFLGVMRKNIKIDAKKHQNKMPFRPVCSRRPGVFGQFLTLTLYICMFDDAFLCAGLTTGYRAQNKFGR